MIDWLSGPAPEVAPRVLGCTLVADGPEGEVRGTIIEVEAYTEDDTASHSHRGPTSRNASMYSRAGTLYVYLIYGLHHCANVVTGPAGTGEAVLIRAVRVTEGREVVARRRVGRRQGAWTDGPGKVCAAFGIDRNHDGLDLLAPGSPVRLEPGSPVDPETVAVGPRVGIRTAIEVPWRWWIDRAVTADASSTRADGSRRRSAASVDRRATRPPPGG